MIAVEKFSKAFGKGTPNEVQALKSVSLKVEESEFVVIIGTNGSGKSTLLNAIAGSFFGDAGRITIARTDVTKLRDFERAPYIGRVFQNPFSGTSPTMTVEENLQLAFLRGESKSLRIGLNAATRTAMRGRVAELGMGLENRMETPIGLLSGGQRQALTLLMATFKAPKVLLLDEHTAALDPKSAEQVLRITEEIVVRYKLTALMVTHAMAQAVRCGSRLIMMNEGQPVLDVANAEKWQLTEQDLIRKFLDLHITDII